MARRIEQSGRHGPHDPRWTSPVLAVSESPLPPEEPEGPAIVLPRLKLVGGTDVASTPLDGVALPRA
jgi:hypothetical protein